MSGDCRVCPLLPQTKWYFAGEWLAISNEKVQADISVTSPHWLADAPFIESPPPVWLGQPESIHNVKLESTEDQIRWPNGQRQNWQVIDEIPQNQSYWNAESAAFFAGKTVHMRGATIEDSFIAETIWPVDFSIQSTSLRALSGQETIEDWIRADQGGVSQPHSDRLIWQRDQEAAKKATDKPVLAIMLNGAQGDDHEALAGHFALVTGKFDTDGQYANWLVNNFYSLDVVSEKGIIAAVTPMDKYLADLNSGQNYYRPSYMLVATLNDAAPVQQIQHSMNQIMQHFYRQTVQYQHATMNCSGISLDGLKALGWQLPERGSNGMLMAIGAYFYSLFTEGSLTEARQLYDYLITETSRLLPAVAFDLLSNDLIKLAENRGDRPLSDFEQQLAGQLDAMWLVRIPQIPSSRALGDAPVFSFQEYLDTAPANRDDWKSIVLPAQNLPASLQSTRPANPAPFPMPWPVILILCGLILLLAGVAYRLRQRYHC
ncbi:MAG: hypothetical protein WD177_05025 [Methylophaga sp.]